MDAPYSKFFEQIFIENIFIECEYYYDSSLRRAGKLLAEREHAFFDKRCQAVSSMWVTILFQPRSVTLTLFYKEIMTIQL